MEIRRDHYLQELVQRKHNTLIKVVPGIRRCGKSYLLFKLFREHLLSSGVTPDHILALNLDDFANISLRSPGTLLEWVRSRLRDSAMHYVLLDEIQYVPHFEEVLNSLLHDSNADVYVTGSNSRFLASDIITEFRGRGDEVHLYPLSFAEYCAASGEERHSAWQSYLTYGGLPLTLSLPSHEAKANYLQRLVTEVYLKDILERNNLRNSLELQELLQVLASSVGSLASPRKLAATFQSSQASGAGHAPSPNTIAAYCKFFEEAFLLHRAERYDIRGRHYINSLHKFYFEDLGLRNAALNFRQTEENHIMENIIYNELRLRGFNVDVGILQTTGKNAAGKAIRQQFEVDFVANQGSQRYYIQSALRMDDDEKREQENRPLRKVGDSFKKIIVTGPDGIFWRNQDGHVIINILDFLLAPNSLDL